VAEAISHSPYWDDTAIFVLEDDAQDGADHVDSHRSPALVISRYAPSSAARSFVDHGFYTTVNVIRTMEEFHRLLVPGGRVFIVTPHYTDFSSYCDPTHRWHLNSFSLRYFTDNHGGFGYYSSARFREISTVVKLLAFWRYLGFEFLVNHSRRFRRFWEFYLCYLVRGKVIEWQLEAVKDPSDLYTPNSSCGS